MKAKVIKNGEIVDVYHEPQHGQITNIYKESVLVNGRMWTEDELDFSAETSEAPEKLYIDLFKGEFNVSYSPTNNSVEYTSTDAFIDKAVKWLEDNAIEYWGTEAVDNGRMIDDFKKAMKL